MMQQVAGQNPHVGNMQGQFAMLRMNALAQQQGAAQVNAAFQDFAGDMRANYEAVLRRCQVLEERDIAREAHSLIAEEAHRNAMQQNAAVINQLVTRLDEAVAKINALEEKLDGHTHRYRYNYNGYAVHERTQNLS